MTDLPDGCLTAVLDRLDLHSIIAAQLSCKHLRELGRQESVWRTRLSEDFPHHTRRMTPGQPYSMAYVERYGIQRRWRTGEARCQELRMHTGPVFAVTSFTDDSTDTSAIITGGVFGYGEVPELFQWNNEMVGLNLEWPAYGELGGVLAIDQRRGYPEIIVGGFSGTTQIVALEENDPSSMDEGALHTLCAGALPPAWLSLAREELVERLESYGPMLMATHTHTLRGHTGAIPASGSSWPVSKGGPGIVATCGFDGITNVWRPAESSPGDGAAVRPQEGEPIATLRDEAQSFSAAAADGAHAGEEESAEESQSVCAVVVQPDGRSLATGCNDRLVRLWDVERREVQRRLRGHSGWVWCLEPYPDQESLLLSGATDGTVRCWDMRSPDSSALTHLLQVAEPTSEGPHSGAVAGIALRPDGRALVAGCFDTKISIVDLRTWSVSAVLEGHSNRITRVAATDDSIFSASFDSSVRHWSFF